ncbi:hydroxymethylbilane synthase [Carnobacterium gallinarum]|uniref:hydroxymethylbilane synthase n=1 Tax=Carnobacterium gallinarum TaxID=2749 RepID=UPI00068A8FF0|nr:hydroxymethylbilane synthase [Carnobacterium gallinarum]
MEASSKRIKVGTRKSPLAIKQTKLVLAELKKVDPTVEFELIELSTKGDRDKKTALSQMESEGIFTDEVELALLNQQIDFAVHSLKDMPAELATGLMIASIPEREIPVDCLIMRQATSIAELPIQARIGTSSLRREVELLRLRSDLTPCSIRGNIDNRLQQLASGEFDGIILAVAGLKRLGWENQEQFTVVSFTSEEFIPSVGQAALALECRQEDAATRNLLEKVNHPSSMACILAERSFLKTLNVGSNMAIGGYGVHQENQEICLTAMFSDKNRKHYQRVQVHGVDANLLGKQAAQLILENYSKRGDS